MGSLTLGVGVRPMRPGRQEMRRERLCHRAWVSKASMSSGLSA